MVVITYKHTDKVVVKILQSSAVTQTTSGGLTIYPPVANLPKNMKIGWCRQRYCKNCQAYFWPNPVSDSWWNNKYDK